MASVIRDLVLPKLQESVAEQILYYPRYRNISLNYTTGLKITNDVIRLVFQKAFDKDPYE